VTDMSEPSIPRLSVEQVMQDLVVMACSERTFAERVETSKKIGRTITAHWRLAGMVGVLVVEVGEQLIWVDDEMWSSSGIKEDAADLAVKNLRRKTPTPLLTTRMHPDHAVFIIGEDDGLGSGRVILHDLFAPLAKLLGQASLLVRVIQTGLVVCCPNTPGDMAFVDELVSKAENLPGFVGGRWLAWFEKSWAEIEIVGD
jgi:hypothetical protein